MKNPKSNRLYFRFEQHPGDFFRNTSTQAIPDPDEEQEKFWILRTDFELDTTR